MPLGEIDGAVKGITETYKLIRSHEDAAKDIEMALLVRDLVGKIGDTQSQLLAVQSEMFTLTEENKRLKDYLTESESWRERTGQYKLHDLGGHNFAMRWEGEDEEPHDACKLCFERDKLISPLNRATRHNHN